MATSHSVRDGTKVLTFEGDLLAHLSSRRPTAPRWTEMSLYRTAGGSYVFEKIGRSKVVHMPTCNRLVQPLPRFQDEHPGGDPDNGFEYCSCVGDEYDFTQLLVEEDRFSAIVATDPDSLISSLYKRRDGARELPQMTVTLLEQAAANDDQLEMAMHKEEHIA